MCIKLVTFLILDILESFPDFWSATFQTSTMKTSDNVLLKSAAVYDLFQNGTDVKLFCRICRKTMDSDGPNEILLKKVRLSKAEATNMITY